MTKPAAWGAAIAAGSLALAISIGSPTIMAWAEEPPAAATNEDPAVTPVDPTVPAPVTPAETVTPADPTPVEAPVTDTPAPEVSQAPTQPAPADSAVSPEAVAPAPVLQDSPNTTSVQTPTKSISKYTSSQSSSRDSDEPAATDAADLSVLGITTATPATPLQLQLQPETAATAKPTATPAPSEMLDSADSTSSAAATNLSPLAVIVLVSSLSLIVLLGAGNFFYRTRIANRQQPRSFPRR